jgi:PUA-domain protein
MQEMPEKHKRYFLKSKDAKTLLETAQERLRVDLEQLLGGKIEVEVLEVESSRLILINGKPALFDIHGKICPTLKFEEYFHVAPKAIVDMGAIPFVCKGANVMAPGIRRLEGEFKKDSIIYVIDEKYGKPIAVGEAMYDLEEMRNIKKGIVIKNLHYVGDKTWNAIKETGFMDSLRAKP